MSHSGPFAFVLVTVLALLGCSCSGRDTTSETHQETSHHEEETHAETGHHESETQRVELTAETRQASGIEVVPASFHRLRVTLDLPGEVAPNADRLAHIVPRFPGIAREVRKGLGEHVNQGDVLAVIESNQSLETYEVRSLISGTVIEKHVTLGEFLRDDEDIYVVADLSTVWVNISAYAHDVSRIRRGQNVQVEAVSPGLSAEGRIDYVGSVVGEATRAATARVVLENSGRRWRPGMFVTARIVIDEREVPVAVPDNAIQKIDGRDVVFVEDGDGFSVRPVAQGNSDGEWTEIVSGLNPGDRYVIRGAFILKSELQKSEAGHEH